MIKFAEDFGLGSIEWGLSSNYNLVPMPFLKTYLI